MFLLILDKNPYKAAELIPDRLKFKQLLELCQLLAGCEITKRMKPVKTGKEIQKWILKNKGFVFVYYHGLFNWVKSNINISIRTWEKFYNIENDLYFSCKERKWQEPKTAIFRYVKEYAEFTEYESNSELPIDVAINEYKRYLEYKEKEYNKKRCKK